MLLILIRQFLDREEQESGEEDAGTTTYRHVAHLWQNWLPPKAMTTLEKGEKNSNVQFTLKNQEKKICDGNDMAEVSSAWS